MEQYVVMRVELDHEHNTKIQENQYVITVKGRFQWESVGSRAAHYCEGSVNGLEASKCLENQVAED